MAADEPVADPAFRAVGAEEIYRGHVIRVLHADFEGPGGERFRRDVIRTPGAVAVVPLLDGDDGPEVLLVRQYRPAVDRWLLEIPAGLRDRPDEAPEATAARELVEETGFAAGRLELLTCFYNAAGMTDHHTHVFLAGDLRPVGAAADGIEEAYLQLVRVPLSAWRGMIERQELLDGKTIIGLQLASARLGR